MKNLILAITLPFLSVFGTPQSDFTRDIVINESCSNNTLTNGLESNQTTLFYMYSDNSGYYFIDPLADSENVVYVGLNDYKVLSELEIDVDTLHHGKRFIGTFDNDALWELIGLEEVDYE